LPEIGAATASAEGAEPESVWAFVQGLMAEVLQVRGFDVFSPFAEKHGSWEATFYRSEEHDANQILRFISLDFTEDRDSYVVEVWVLAESEPENRDRAKYYRRMVHQFTTQNQVKFFKKNQDVAADFRLNVTTALNKAADIVLGFQSEHLTATYPRFAPHDRSRSARNT
jgi:hypothetical protein